MSAQTYSQKSLFSLFQTASKVILSTRPQGIALIRGAMSGAGVDARHIQELPSLKRLTTKDTRQIVVSLLGHEFRSLANTIVAQARGSLLIAIVACEMIRQKRITKSHLASHQDFEQAVFVRLIDERIAKLGLITDRDRIDRILELVALVGPMPREGRWFELLCEWAAPANEASKIRAWLDDLKRCGLLVEKGDGYRIAPDLLSDYVLFRATFDTGHRDTGFVADVLARVADGSKDDVLARCLPNLAEAEWRARCEADGQQQSIVDPLLKRWLNQFRSASFKRRREMLGHWSRFGVYLPEQTVRIARLAWELGPARASNKEGIFALRDDHSDALDAITPLLKEVARYHPAQMHACFDLLWQIGRDEPKRWENSNQYHPLSAIIEVARLEYRKDLTVNEMALTWVEKTSKSRKRLRSLIGRCGGSRHCLIPFSHIMWRMKSSMGRLSHCNISQLM